MSLKQALALSGALMFGQVNANVNPDYRYANFWLSNETTSQVKETTESIETIVNELNYLKQKCSLKWIKEKKDWKKLITTESLECEEWNWEINTKLVPFNTKVSYKWAKYYCFDLETSIKISQLISDWGNSVILNWKWSILESKKTKLLMWESCTDINDFNK